LENIPNRQYFFAKIKKVIYNRIMKKNKFQKIIKIFGIVLVFLFIVSVLLFFHELFAHGIDDPKTEVAIIVKHPKLEDTWGLKTKTGFLFQRDVVYLFADYDRDSRLPDKFKVHGAEVKITYTSFAVKQSTFFSRC